jgi:hypothetical protein
VTAERKSRPGLAAPLLRGLNVVLRHLWTLLTAGVVIIAVPTVYTLFAPEIGSSALWVRALVAVLWLIAALVAVLAGLRQSSMIDDLLGPSLGERTEMREEAAALILARLLDPAGPLGRYEWRLFMPDPEDQDTLAVPAFAPMQSATTWPVGVGVTGVAYSTGESQYALGDEISELYPITENVVDGERRTRHARLKVVAAMPVRSALGTTLGVLTASSERRSAYVTQREGQREHARLADAVARVLIDLVGFGE